MGSSTSIFLSTLCVMKNGHRFPDLGEFQFVNDMLKGALPLPCNVPFTRSWLSAGDDCAQFDGWLVTKDMSAEGTHFRLDFSTPEEAVEKCIVSNVSDISAMGGTPSMALLGICHSKKWDINIRTRIAQAFRQGLLKRNIALIGGDTIAADTGLFSMTLLGTPGKTLLCRNNAHPGDNLYVISTLGKSAAGLWIFLNGKQNACDKELESLLKYHVAPSIQEDAGALLTELGVCGACMDISDGLSSELNHLALSSGVSIEIDEKLLPIDPLVQKMAQKFKVSALEFALNGGEEYQLLFSSALDESIFKEKFPYLVTKIGKVVQGEGVYIKTGSEKRILPAKAWTHL